MKEFVEKLIEWLEEISVSKSEEGIINGCNMGICEYDDCMKCLKKKLISNINKLSEEHNNDCCEWRKEPSRLFGYFRNETSCGDSIDLQANSELLKAFIFCPFCGKKIKVVE